MLHPPPVRPTFELPLAAPVARVVETLHAALAENAQHPFQARGPHLVLTVRPDARHFWSPWLTMEAAPAETGSVLHGRFSPKPTVWTGFMLAYIALTTAGCFGLMFAVSQVFIGHSAWLALVLSALFLLAALGLYIASQVGQRLARAQMDELQDIVRGALASLHPAPSGG